MKEKEEEKQEGGKGKEGTGKKEEEENYREEMRCSTCIHGTAPPPQASSCMY